MGIDLQSTVGEKTGIGYYASSLFDFLSRDHKEINLEAFKKDRQTDLNTLERMFWENVALPGAAERSGVDILHIPGLAGPRMRRRFKKVTTVCDLIGMIYPQNLGPMSRFYWGKWLPACVNSSDRIIAISECTRNDVVRFLNVPEKNVEVIYLACEKRFKPITDRVHLDEVRTKYSFPGRFCLNLGTIEPRKNVSGLVKAFASYLGRSDSDLRLVIAGKKGWAYNKVCAEIKERGLEGKICFADYVEDEDLPALYNLAEFFVYPSFYEGFGLPVLEALSCGRAVICSNSSSLPEVAGEAALMVDPESSGDLSTAIEKLDTDIDFRGTLSIKALAQAKKFSWHITAENTAKVYRGIL